MHIIFRKESYFLLEERKCLQREIGENPTKCLESNELDPFRFGKDMTERKMPVFCKCLPIEFLSVTIYKRPSQHIKNFVCKRDVSKMFTLLRVK